MKFSVTKDDFEITWFSGKGGGGQHRNRHKNCCRLKHKATNIVATGQSHKERKANQKEAFEKIANNPFFRAYCEEQLKQLEGKLSAKDWVEEQMKEENIQIQRRNQNGRWENWFDDSKEHIS
jgi:protein subunit release factor B